MRRQALALSALAGFFALLEAVARLAPVPPRILPEYSPLFAKFASDLRRPFFRPEERGGRVVMVPGRSVDVFHDTAFERRKPKGRFRVICVGESTVALGDFTRSLGAYLKASLPGVDSEVINAGQGFVNPPRVLEIFRETLSYEPDALVVYMGHNFRHEIPRVGPAGLAVVGWAERSAALRWAVAAVRAARGGARPPMGEEARQAAFERALAEMAALAKARGIPLVVCTAASNLLLPPHFSPASVAPDRRPGLGAALAELESGRWERAKERFRALSAHEDGVALLHYFAGVAAREAGRRREARRLLSRARDLDFDDRAPDALNRAVRRLSGGESLYRVADVEAEFDAAAADGVPGFGLFIDQCHPRRREYRLISRPVARALERAGFFAGRWRRLTPSQEDAALAAAAPPETRAETLQSLLNTGFIAALNATYYGEPGFSEIPTRYFEEALRLDPAAALARLRDPGAADVLKEVLSPTQLDESLRRRTRAFALVHAGAALRRLGRGAEARALWRAAAPALDGRLLSELRLQEAVLARREGRTREEGAALDAALAAWDGVTGEPLYMALHAPR